MAIDDPISALKRQLEFEELSAVPYLDNLCDVLGMLLSLLKADPVSPHAISAIEKLRSKDEQHCIAVLLETLEQELRRLSVDVESILAKLAPAEQERTAKTMLGLIADASRKATATRSEQRVKRIAAILAHGLAALKIEEADEIDEMMRIAMELTDRDVDYLGKLVRLEGGVVKANGRINRYEADRRWEESEWGRKNDPEVEGTFAKLESYGLVWQLPSQNNMNVMADIMNGYALLAKGLRFVELIASA